MSMITEKAVEKGLQLLDTAASLAAAEGPKLLNEYLDLMIFEALLGALPGLLWSLGLIFVVRWINAAISTWNFELADTKQQLVEEESKQKAGVCSCKSGSNFCCERSTDFDTKVRDLRSQVKSDSRSIENMKHFRAFIIVVATLISIHSSLPTIERIGKISIAPKVFLLQEGAKIIKK